MNTQNLSRRGFLKLAGGAILTLASGCAFSDAAPAAVEKAQSLTRKAVRALTGDTSLDALRLRQIITADSRTSRTIMWHSDDPQANAEVAWRLPGSDDCQVASASSALYTDDGQHIYLHSATITGLAPGARYEYRLLSGAQGTAWRPLQTDDGGSFKALIFPDTQCSDGYVTWRNVAQDAARRHSDAAFVINMGDLVDNGEDHNQWNQWFDALEGISDRLPLAPILGNHETYTRDWKTRWPEAYLALSPFPRMAARNLIDTTIPTITATSTSPSSIRNGASWTISSPASRKSSSTGCRGIWRRRRKHGKSSFYIATFCSTASTAVLNASRASTTPWGALSCRFSTRRG